MDNEVIINGIKYIKVEGWECSKCDLRKDDTYGFCGAYVLDCGNFHYEESEE